MNNENNNNVSRGGICFCDLLAIAFIVLKLCGVITWSWWWVLAPVWMPIAFLLLIAVIGIIIIVVKKIKER